MALQQSLVVVIGAAWLSCRLLRLRGALGWRDPLFGTSGAPLSAACALDAAAAWLPFYLAATEPKLSRGLGTSTHLLVLLHQPLVHMPRVVGLCKAIIVALIIVVITVLLITSPTSAWRHLATLAHCSLAKTEAHAPSLVRRLRVYIPRSSEQQDGEGEYERGLRRHKANQPARAAARAAVALPVGRLGVINE